VFEGEGEEEKVMKKAARALVGEVESNVAMTPILVRDVKHKRLCIVYA
jgi:hypothetical protein